RQVGGEMDQLRFRHGECTYTPADKGVIARSRWSAAKTTDRLKQNETRLNRIPAPYGDARAPWQQGCGCRLPRSGLLSSARDVRSIAVDVRRIDAAPDRRIRRSDLVAPRDFRRLHASASRCQPRLAGAALPGCGEWEADHHHPELPDPAGRS